MHRNYRLLHVYMTAAYVAKEMYREAVAELEKSLALSGAGPGRRACWRISTDGWAEREDARRCCPRCSPAEMCDAYPLALAYVGLGETDEAFKWLDEPWTHGWERSMK